MSTHNGCTSPTTMNCGDATVDYGLGPSEIECLDGSSCTSSNDCNSISIAERNACCGTGNVAGLTSHKCCWGQIILASCDCSVNCTVDCTWTWDATGSIAGFPSW